MVSFAVQNAGRCFLKVKVEMIVGTGSWKWWCFGPEELVLCLFILQPVRCLSFVLLPHWLLDLTGYSYIFAANIDIYDAMAPKTTISQRMFSKGSGYPRLTVDSYYKPMP